MAPFARAYSLGQTEVLTLLTVELVRKARNAECPESFWADSIDVILGASEIAFIGANDDIEI